MRSPLPDFPWDALAPYGETARKHPSGIIDLSQGTPVDSTPEFIQNQTGKYLHRFSWLNDDEIGEIPKEWNWLAIEYPENHNAKLIHYTLGTPCFKEYEKTDMADIWYKTFDRVKDGIGK